jgi:FlaG/FlaF family flagellin (archaellin)
LKGIAEATGVILMGLVTLAIATTIFIVVAGQLSEVSQRMERAAVEAEVAPKERPVILQASYNSSTGDVMISIASSSYPVSLVDVYINGVKSTPNCSVDVGGVVTGFPREIPGNTAALVTCTAPPGLGRVEVRIAYEGISSGLVVAYAG